MKKQSNLYDKLGIKKGASKEEIKKAYRQKAKENHPDKKGGDNEKMTEITQAYDILSNDRKKAKYDATGETRETPFGEKFIGYINEIFIQIIEKTPDIEHEDLIDTFLNHSHKILLNLINNKKDQEKKLKKYIAVRKRIKATTSNHIILVLDSKIEGMTNNVNASDEEAEFIKKCIEVLGSYEYEFEIPDHMEYDTISFSHE